MWYLLSCSLNLSLKAQLEAEILSFKVWVPAVQKNAKFWKKLYLGQKKWSIATRFDLDISMVDSKLHVKYELPNLNTSQDMNFF